MRRWNHHDYVGRAALGLVSVTIDTHSPEAPKASGFFYDNDIPSGNGGAHKQLIAMLTFDGRGNLSKSDW